MVSTRLLSVVAALLVPLTLSQRSHADGPVHRMPPTSMDQRSPLPLPAMMAEHQKQNMREHLTAIQGIVAAIARDDMDGVAKAASRIGFSEAMGQMCEHMGAAAPGFTERALDFHHTADTIGDAARRGDRPAVLTALDRTLQACVGCHATYRQEIVDETTWQRLTKAAAPSGSSPPSP
jgi:cytochrome c556